MKKIFLGELKASKYAKSRTFKDKKLPKGFSHHLHSLLVYLRNKKIENFPNIVSSQNIDVTIEFLLVFLNDDASNHVINGTWLNEVMEKAGAIAGDVLYFPTIGGLSFLDSLLRKLHDMLIKSKSGLVFMMKPGIGCVGKSKVAKELSSLSTIFRDVARVHSEHKILRDLQRRTINLVYDSIPLTLFLLSIMIFGIYFAHFLQY
ncbi:hypothetical protein RDI58_023534 [Solanum bulbocastanum]|uniref:Uncharacterized protein n=1 Tax=Solanum bulbocastanum TaxID=147425 RepID=A0AAN8T647_SOLBU